MNDYNGGSNETTRLDMKMTLNSIGGDPATKGEANKNDKKYNTMTTFLPDEKDTNILCHENIEESPFLHNLPSNSTRERKEFTFAERYAMSESSIFLSATAVIFCVLVDAMRVQAAGPNYPLMCSVGSHPDSFPSTYPFGPAAAQYMISCASGTGLLISNLVGGYAADKYGKKKVILFNLLGSIALCIVKYFSRRFWLFVISSFVNGLFGSTPAVGLAYMGDLFSGDRVKVDTYMGYILATLVFGRTAGGLMALFTPWSLFTPLLIAAALTFFGFFIGKICILEPNDLRFSHSKKVLKEETTEKEISDYEKGQMDNSTVFNVAFGALLDNAGSSGLVPLCLTPLMFDTYYADFSKEGLEPVMSTQSYKTLYSLVAILAVPGAILSPTIYKKFGVAVTCVATNAITGVVTFALLSVSQIDPTTTGTFFLYVTILYLGFSFAIISQLTTGPMLDRIAPPDKKGFVQGINAAIVDSSSAIFPFLYGLLTDTHGIDTTLHVCVWICMIAALVNAPLISHPCMRC